MIELQEIKRDHEFKVKLILFGPKGVGKSSFISKLIYNDFHIQKSESIGIEIGSKYYEHNQKMFKVDIWDASGGADGLIRLPVFWRSCIGIF